MRRLAGGFLLLLGSACFDAPSADVLFACEPQGASACPPDYACRADGCCHREGSDVQANFGRCRGQTLTSGDDAETTTTASESEGATTSSSGGEGSASQGSTTDESEGGASDGGSSATSVTSTGASSTTSDPAQSSSSG